MAETQYLLIVMVALLAIASPGPAALAITGMSMSQKRAYGLALAGGVLTGSFFWSVSAAFGFSALMLPYAWFVEFIRYLGAAYLLYLSFKYMRSAARDGAVVITPHPTTNYLRAYAKGLLIHLTNPKAILFFGSLYSLGVSPAATTVDLLTVILVVGCVSSGGFLGYALLFSLAPVRRIYAKSRRVFESALALLFGLAAVKLLTRNAA